MSVSLHRKPNEMRYSAPQVKPVNNDPIRSSIHEARLPDVADSVELLDRAQQGDNDALNRLLERYQGRLRRIVRIRMSSKMRQNVESMDIVQGALEVAYRRIDKFEMRKPGSILHWLAKIAENKLRDENDYWNAERRDKGREEPMVFASDSSSGHARQLDANASNPADKASHRELQEIVDQTMEELPEDYREIILLRDYTGADWDYITELMQRPNVHAAQELHRRAWIRLRRHIRPKLSSMEPE